MENKEKVIEKKALGRGLSSLLGERTEQVYHKPLPLFSPAKKEEVSGGISYVSIKELSAGSFQPRENFDEQKMKELMSSIQEKGVLQPILARKKDLGWEIIAGERRFRAAQALGLKEVPVMVKEVSDQDALVISLVENIQRQELNPIEEAQAFQELLEKFQYSQEDISKALGKDKTTISNTLRLLKLPKEIQRQVIKGSISFGHAKVLLSIEDAVKQWQICQDVVIKSLSVRELENLIHEENLGSSKRKKRIGAAKTGDPYVLEIERSLQNTLGTKVRIITNKKRGKVVIDFYSPQDLERIVNIIK